MSYIYYSIHPPTMKPIPLAMEGSEKMERNKMQFQRLIYFLGRRRGEKKYQSHIILLDKNFVQSNLYESKKMFLILNLLREMLMDGGQCDQIKIAKCL